jgi:hypothetical protein
MTTTPRGGPATITGVLFQMLWSLFRTTTLRVDDCEQDEEGAITSACLVLEPTTGGDLTVDRRESRVVEQVKSKSGNGTWSLRKIIDHVIPDLFRAVDLDDPNREFRFVTNSRIGQWGKVYSFFKSLRERPCPANGILAALDDREVLRSSARGKGRRDTIYWPEAANTERVLFEWIVQQQIAQANVGDSVNDDEVRRRLWQLLGHFEFIAAQTSENLQASIDATILELIDHREDIPTIRDAMLQELARRASTGCARIDRETFFAKFLLDTERLSDWQTLAANGKMRLHGKFERHGYVPLDDVRADEQRDILQDWSSQHPIVIFSGESGQGKSWSLFALGNEIASNDELCVFVSATGNADTSIQKAADEFWQEIKGNNRSLSLSGIAARRREVVQHFAENWLTILVDNVQSVDEARNLARQDWEKWGVRLAVSCSSQVAAATEAESRGRASVVQVQDFTAEQLQRFLTKGMGDAWADIPGDVRETLRRPLLASLFRTVSSGKDWCPTNEYELYEAYWQRLRSGTQTSFPLDETLMGKAVQAFLDGKPYPWTVDILHRNDFDDAAVLRLRSVGWLRETEEHRYEIWHDRLLNWAVAKRLVARLNSADLTHDKLSNRVVELSTSSSVHGEKHLGCVPMDVVWLLSQESSNADALDTLFARLANSDSGIDQRQLYSELLPTIGGAIVPALIRRVVKVAEKDDPVELRLVVEAVASLDSAEIVVYAQELLVSKSRFVQRAGMQLITKRPSGDALDRLWEIRCDIMSDRQAFLRPNENEFDIQTEPSHALNACVQSCPHWLEEAIDRCAPATEPIEVLGWMLANLSGGRDVWLRTKAKLFKKVAPSEERCLAVNVYVHNDESEVDWLLERIRRKDEWIAPLALRGLARIAPDLAIKHLSDISSTELYFTREWCFSELLIRRPELVRHHLLELLKKEQDPWRLAMVYQGREHAIDVPTLEFILDELEKHIKTDLVSSPDDSSSTLFQPLRMLSDINSIGLLDCFTRRRGSPLEDDLTKWILRIGPRKGVYCDSLNREPAMNILYKIGGSGYVSVVNSWLSADDHFGRYDGLMAARKRANEETVELLAGIATCDQLWESLACEQGWATEALAALGEWRHVVDSVIRWGLRTHQKVCLLCPTDGSWTNEVLGPALTIVQGGKPTPGAILAIGDSGRRDLIDLVHDAANSADVDSDLAHACVLSLGRLGDRSEQAMRFFARQLEIPNHRHSATVGLMKIGTPAAVKPLTDQLAEGYDHLLAMNLLKRRETQKVAAQAVWDEMRRPKYNGMVETLLSCLGLLPDPEIRDYLRETALAPDGAGVRAGGRCDAILGVAKSDPEAAFLAARKGFADRDGRDRSLYPHLLMQLDQDRAIPILLDGLVQKPDSGMTAAIGRALTNYDVNDWLFDGFESHETLSRQAACSLAGWREPTDQIRTALLAGLDDPDNEVVKAAKSSLYLLDRAMETNRLVERICVTENRDQRWILLDAILALADPGEADNPPPAWLGKIVEHLTPAMQLHLEEEIQRYRSDAKRP